MRRLAACCSALLWLGAASADDAPRAEARALLEAAFENQYDVDLTARIELTIRNAHGDERRRDFVAAAKRIDGRLHSIGRLVYPLHLRGMTLLQIEAGAGRHDAFVYLPSLRSVRRISTAQRGDAFFGTDLTYEDLERRRAEDYRVLSLESVRLRGEPAYLVRVTPRRPLAYDEARFWIAASDHAILESRYLKRGAREPFRTVEAPRASMVAREGHVLPTRLVVHNLSRRTTTEVHYRGLRINPPIDDRVFSIRTLEQRAPIAPDP